MAKLFTKLRAMLSPAEAIVLIEDGRATNLRGKVATGLLSELSDVATLGGVTEGLVKVSRSNNGATLSFSRSIPEKTHQRFRNVWFAYPEGKRLRR